MRAAALRADGPDARPDKACGGARASIEAAIVARRQLESEGGSPLELVAEVESLVRAILRDAVRGRLGTDLRAAADETLLADGLAAGEGASVLRGSTAEWGAVDSEPGPMWATESEVSGQSAEPEAAVEEPLPEPIELRPVEPEEDDPGAYEPDTYVSSEAFEEPTRTIEGATDTLLAATEDAEDEGRNEPAEAEEDLR